MTEERDEPIRTSDGHTVAVDFFRPEDAPGIVALFQEVYGDAYPIKVFYDPDGLIRANRAGDTCSIVARTESGEVAGVTHVFRSAPYRWIYESGGALVLRKYRAQGINNRMEWFVFHRWAPARPEVEGIYGEAVCRHLHLQKAAEGLGAVDMALEVALMPGEAYSLEKGTAGRVACVFGYWSIRQRPHPSYLPAAYEEALRFLYSGLREERSFMVSEQALPSDQETRCEAAFFDFASVARLAFHDTGADLAQRVRGIEAEMRARGAKVIQAWLNLGCPWVGAAAALLRQEGYFLGGLLPRWFDQDGLLMQKLFCPPDWEEIQLYTDRAKEILKIVRADWGRITQNG